jgi:hypothetical protein
MSLAAATVATHATVSANTDRPPPPAGFSLTMLRRHYLAALTWAFTLFSAVRVFTYLPTMWAIQNSGDSSQHSLWTWLTWTGANLTMAAWLYEHNGQRFNRAVGVNLGNAAMCLVTTGLIVVQRL